MFHRVALFRTQWTKSTLIIAEYDVHSLDVSSDEEMPLTHAGASSVLFGAIHQNALDGNCHAH